MSVRIQWFSPVDARKSEIARYSAQLLPVLSRYANVTALDDGSGSVSPSWWLSREEADSAQPGEASLPIYHIGNNPLHLPIYQRSLQEPGLVVLHDLSLVDLARHLSRELGEADLWKELMCSQYGEEVRGLANRSEKSVADYNKMVTEYPLFQPFIQGALGVVVHSRYALERVRTELADERRVVHLNLPAAAPQTTANATRQEGPVRFVFCGHVGPNRRLLQFMEAWSQISAPQRVRLELFGNVANDRQLMQYAKRFGLADHLTLHGYVDEGQLEAALHAADFALNLRFPTMGEASASQLRYWSAALPTLVSDVGWYNELPTDSVCPITVDNEIQDLRDLLESAIASPERFEAIGLRGFAHLQEAHQPDAYAKGFVGLAKQLLQQRLAYRTLDQNLVAVIASLCQEETDSRLFRNAVETAVAMFAVTE
ncbi:MAG: glycosyltransferase [Pseudomonadota bacterium]